MLPRLVARRYEAVAVGTDGSYGHQDGGRLQMERGSGYNAEGKERKKLNAIVANAHQQVAAPMLLLQEVPRIRTGTFEIEDNVVLVSGGQIVHHHGFLYRRRQWVRRP